MPEDHEGRQIYGLRPDPTPGEGRHIGRLEESTGREIRKSKADEVDKVKPDEDDTNEADEDATT